MISPKMQDALNEQINAELFSSYLYLAMAAWFESVNLPGFAQWMMAQSREENTHAMKLYKYLNDHGARVILKAIAAPDAQYKSALDVFQQVLRHEQKVTGLIHKLYDLATREKDYASEVELQWFVKEQVEEEKNATDIVEKLKMVGDSKNALLMIDHHMGARK